MISYIITPKGIYDFKKLIFYNDDGTEFYVPFCEEYEQNPELCTVVTDEDEEELKNELSEIFKEVKTI